MSVAIITDSSSDLSPAQAREFGVEVVPLWIIFGNERLRDGVDIQRSVFYSRLAGVKDLPHTEPTSEEEFAAIFARYVTAGTDVVAPLISSKLSETYRNAAAAATRFPGRVHVVDSQTFSGGLILQALAASEMAKRGLSGAEIASALKDARARQSGYFIMPDLSYLGRTGRLNKAIVALGTMLKVCPVLRLNNGLIESTAQTRTFEKAQELLVEIATRAIGEVESMRFAVGHANTPDAGAVLERALRTKLGASPKTMLTFEAGPAVAVHGGPGSLAIFSLGV